MPSAVGSMSASALNGMAAAMGTAASRRKKSRRVLLRPSACDTVTSVVRVRVAFGVSITLAARSFLDIMTS